MDITQQMAMGYDNFLEDQYKVPILAKILHSLPHLNITFHRTNNTFRPTDEIYLEVNSLDRKQNRCQRFSPIKFTFLHTESGHFGINSGSRSHPFTLLPPALLDVEMLWPQAASRSLHHQLEGYIVDCNSSLLCSDWTWWVQRLRQFFLFFLFTSMIQWKVFTACEKLFPLSCSPFCIHKRHKISYNSMNHAHNHLHDSFSFSLHHPRRQIKFDLVSTLIFFLLATFAFRRVKIYETFLFQDFMEMTTCTTGCLRFWQPVGRLTISCLQYVIRRTLWSTRWRRRFDLNWRNWRTSSMSLFQIKRRCQCSSTRWTWCRRILRLLRMLLATYADRWWGYRWITFWM